ncbi:hypothetical protein ACNKXS_03420 [Christiangramia marina]|uniref:hypothetical protein n=1 Tax=Christiangramia marina TaxID=409436 RepID=UPI003AA84DDD
MIEILKPYLGELLVLIIGSLLGWFVERKRKKVEVRNLTVEGNKAEADYSKSMLDIYQDALTDLKDRYEEKFCFLKKEYDLQFTNLNLRMERLKKDQEMWKNRYSKLKREFEDYRKSHP